MHQFTTPVVKGDHPHKKLPCFGFMVGGSFMVEVSERDVSLEDQSELTRINALLEVAAENALNAGCLEIQEKMGVETGAVAGVYFSGSSTQYGIALALRDYLAFEIQMAKD